MDKLLNIIEDSSFGIPGKVLRYLLIGALIVSIMVGVITWNSEKGIKFYFASVGTIMTPVFNKMWDRAIMFSEFVVGFIFKDVFERLGNI